MPEYQEVHQLRLCYGIGCLPLVDARRGLLVTLLCGGRCSAAGEAERLLKSWVNRTELQHNKRPGLNPGRPNHKGGKESHETISRD